MLCSGPGQVVGFLHDPLGLTAVCVKFLRIHVKIVHTEEQIPFFFLECKSEK